MSDAENKEQEPCKGDETEDQQVQDNRPAEDDEETQGSSSDGARREETEIPGQSQVYTATKDTLFQNTTTQTKTHALVCRV